jgi:hypothetical protein
MIHFYCTIQQYEKLKKCLEDSGAHIVEESHEEVSAWWEEALQEEPDEMEGLYEQISRFNKGIVP